MATVRRDIVTLASPEAVWEAIEDVGSLHTRLVPGFVVNTVLEGNTRIATFANGLAVREPIVSIDPDERRLAWSSQGGNTTHYNASVQALAEGGKTRVVWIADFLPGEAKPAIEAAMDAGAKAMQAALDRLEAEAQMVLPV